MKKHHPSGDETSSSHKISVAESGGRLLTRDDFHKLAELPAEAEWFANIRNPNTRRAYLNDVSEFRSFVGIVVIEEFRAVKRAHVLAWRHELENRGLADSTVRRKLSALSSLFESLCDANAIQEGNPVSGVKRPKMKSVQTPALSDEQVKVYLEAPDPNSQKAPSRKLKAYRDKAIISTLAYHGLRCSECTGLKIRDMIDIRGVKHVTVRGKGSKLREVPLHPHTLQVIGEYLDYAGHGEDREALIFQSVRSPGKELSQQAVYESIVTKYARMVGLDPREICAHSFRVTAATNAMEHQGAIEEVREWLGHSSISTTDGYIRTRMKAQDSPTFKIRY